MELTEEQLILNEEIILFAIKIMRATDMDYKEIEEAINLHSVIKLRLMK